MTNIVEWKDEELPPVGAVCEVINHDLDNPEWEKCEILFMGRFNAVYNSSSCDERVGSLGSTEFRKIKTDREKTIEAAVDILKLNPLTNYNSSIGLAKLFDAGMLKLLD